MIRTLEDKLTTALDTREYVQTFPLDEDTACLLRVLEDAIADYRRVERKTKIDELTYYRLRGTHAIASLLLEELIAESGHELEGYIYGGAPSTLTELLFCVLNDCVDQFATSLLYGAAKNFQPLSDAELKAILSLAPTAQA